MGFLQAKRLISNDIIIIPSVRRRIARGGEHPHLKR